MLPLQGARVWSLVRELRSCMTHSAAKNKLKIKIKKKKYHLIQQSQFGYILIYMLCVHSSTIHNSHQWKQPKCPLTDEWIHKMWHIHTVEYYSALKRKERGFPGGGVVENLPANAGDTGSSPGLGRSHMPRSNWAREPQLLSLRVWSLCSATTEAAILRGPRTAMKSGPHLPQVEKALAQKQRPNTAKK